MLADAHPAVTVLFADIVDFTPYAERTGPQAVVQLLDRVFSAFDDVADAHGIKKIKTIKDAYCSWVPCPRRVTTTPVRWRGRRWTLSRPVSDS